MDINFKTIILLVSFLLGSNSVYSQPMLNDITQSFDVLEVEKFNVEIVNKIYFYGWSVNGLISYIEYKEIQGRPITSYKFVIQSMVTDRILFETKTVDIQKLIEFAEEGIGEDINRLNKISKDHGVNFNTPEFYYYLFEDEIEMACKKYKIKNRDVNYLMFPFDDGQNTLDGMVKILNKGQSSYDYYKNDYFDIYDYSVEIKKNSLRKIITKEKLRDQSIYDIDVLGCIRSPFEERVAVILSYIQYDHYGGNNISFRFSGCDLTEGFE